MAGIDPVGLPDTQPCGPRRWRRARVQEAVEACSWNFARAALQVGVSRMTLYRLLRKYGISRASSQQR